MRITPFIIFNQLTRSLSRTLLQYSNQNDWLTTGKKINAPSDNPAGLMRAMDYRVTVNANDQYQRNIDMAENNLNSAGTIMTSVYNTMTNIQKLVAKYSNSSSTTDALAAAMRSGDALQASALKDMIRDLANSKNMDQYLFSGFKSGTKPYAENTYAYQGDSGVVNVPVTAAGATMALNVTGDDVFSNTEALPTRQLSDGQYVHYVIAGTTTTVVLNGNATDPPDPADPSETDRFSYSNVVQMTDLLSQALSLKDTDPIPSNDTTGASIAATVTDPASLTADEYLITFDAGGVNYVVTDSQTGQPLVPPVGGAYVSPATIALPGIDVAVSGAVAPGSSFTVSALTRGNDITAVQSTARVAALSDPFIKMQEHLVEVQTDLGGRVSSLKEYSNMLSQNTTTLKDALSAIEDADPIETIAQLKQTEITLQALRDSASRVLSQSLFDFLR